MPKGLRKRALAARTLQLREMAASARCCSIATCRMWSCEIGSFTSTFSCRRETGLNEQGAESRYLRVKDHEGEVASGQESWHAQQPSQDWEQQMHCGGQERVLPREFVLLLLL